MREILQLSDFVLKVSFIDTTGQSAKITKFKFMYTTPSSDSIEASFDGEKYSSNCTVVQDGILIAFKAPRFNCGRLTVHRQYSISSTYFENGTRDINQLDELPMVIVRSYSDKACVNPPCVPVEVFADSIIATEIVVVEAFKGDAGKDGVNGSKGDKGQAGIDYSVKTNNKIDGGYWLNRLGVKSQLYVATFETEYVAAYQTIMPGVSTIMSVYANIIEPTGTAHHVNPVCYTLPNGNMQIVLDDIHKGKKLLISITYTAQLS